MNLLVILWILCAFISIHEGKVANRNQAFFCKECGTQHIKWVGKCTSCQEWNTVIEFKQPNFNDPIDQRMKARAIMPDRPFSESSGSVSKWMPASNPTNFGNIIPMNSINKTSSLSKRMTMFSGEVDRVLGGGLVKGSVTLGAGVGF